MTVTGVITAVVFGSIIGALARLVVPGRQPIPIWVTMLVGILASLVGSLIARSLGFTVTGGVNWLELLVQIVLAVVGVVIAANAYARRGRSALAPVRRVDPRPPAAGSFVRPGIPVHVRGLVDRSPLDTAVPPAATPPPTAPPVSEQPADRRHERPSPPPSRIFVSYRRSDSRYAARGIAEHLRNRFGRTEVFMDVDSVPAGADFVEGVLDAIRASAVVLVLIGDGWVDAHDDRGRRRLDDPGDNVRTEIEHALGGGRPVLPVLLDGVPMPRPDELPDSIVTLHRLNGIRVDHVSWDADVAELVRVVERRRP